jgi:hypothetical protein
MKRVALDYAGLLLTAIGGAIFACGSLLLRKAKQP